MEPTSEDDVKSTLINPYYAISFADYLFKDQSPTVAKEDWVLTNTKLIDDMGTDEWLEQLLITLSVAPTDDIKDLIVSPSKTVVLSERLRGKHESLVDTTGWIKANVKLIKELGTGEWLWQLLKVLQTGGPTEI
jgi:hypothetical protein